jgi:hypothetical protein
MAQSIDSDVILRAMRDELERSKQLKALGSSEDAPYFVSYSVNDGEAYHVNATLGATLLSTHTRVRVPTVQVRIGSYDFDDTGHIFSGIYTGSRLDGAWPLDNSYQVLREALWLATDRAYKTSVESISRKRAAMKNASEASERLPDFSKADAIVSLGKVAKKKFDWPAWESRSVKLSGVFAAYPEVLTSFVDFQEMEGATYIMNSEGTAIRYADNLAMLHAKAEGQAADGMFVRDGISFQQLEIENLQGEADLRKALSTMAENVRALSKAPAGSAFSGPALFEPEAAAQLIAQLIGDNLNVPRKPIAEPGRTVNFVPSELETKLNSRILPDWFDITDDPTQTSWNGRALAGHYEFDDEGVRAKAVTVVERGVLKSFLTTRLPIKGFAESNGHARLPAAYGAHGAAISNLFVKANQSIPLADLKSKLIQMTKDRGKPYGMLVRKLDYPYSGSAQDLRQLFAGASQGGGSARPVSPPVLVYRVYPDGREELVRGLRFRGVSTRSLRDIMAASKETALFDYVNNAAPLALQGAGGLLAPASVVAPALLFEEIEFELPQEQLSKPAIVPPPTARN